MKLDFDMCPVAIVAVLVLLDIVTGLLKAWETNTLSSSVMRTGLLHKCAYFFIVFLCALMQIAQEHYDIWPGFPTVTAICIYIATVEVLSVLENVSVMNPEISEWPIVRQLMRHDDE